MIVLRAAIAQLLRFARLLSVPICIGLVAAQPFLFDARTPRGADVLLHTYRLVALQDLVQHGVWYSQWFPNLAFGYGYPIFQYYAPFTQYVALLLTGLGMTPAQAISSSMALALVLAAVGATLWLRDLWGEQAAWVGAAAFALAGLVQAATSPAAAAFCAISFSAAGLCPGNCAVWLDMAVAKAL